MKKLIEIPKELNQELKIEAAIKNVTQIVYIQDILKNRKKVKK